MGCPCSARSTSLKTMASGAAALPAPLVTSERADLLVSRPLHKCSRYEAGRETVQRNL
jgi:hypothetical protein